MSDNGSVNDTYDGRTDNDILNIIATEEELESLDMNAIALALKNCSGHALDLSYLGLNLTVSNIEALHLNGVVEVKVAPQQDIIMNLTDGSLWLNGTTWAADIQLYANVKYDLTIIVPSELTTPFSTPNDLTAGKELLNGDDTINIISSDTNAHKLNGNITPNYTPTMPEWNLASIKHSLYQTIKIGGNQYTNYWGNYNTNNVPSDPINVYISKYFNNNGTFKTSFSCYGSTSSITIIITSNGSTLITNLAGITLTDSRNFNPFTDLNSSNVIRTSVMVII